MAKRSINGIRVLVTGASSGIGRALAIELARRGAGQLLLTARREKELADVATQVTQLGAAVTCLAGDVTSDSHRNRLLDTVSQDWKALDVLISNAGVGGIGKFADGESDRLRHIMEVNFFAPVELARLFLPLLRQSDRAAIVHMGSVLGHFAVPKKPEYCASKFALHGFTDALRMELAEERIDVVLISPSTTDSEFFQRAHRTSDEVVSMRGAMSAAAVAKASVDALERGQRERILSVGGRALIWCDRLLPGLTGRLLARFA